MNRLPTVLVLWLVAAPAQAAPEPNRLFYTPAQRAQLEQMRSRPAARAAPARPAVLPPLRFDGVVVRSDGNSTRWVNGRAQVGASGPAGLKPGQIRADGKVYEPYQLLPPPSEGNTP
ncbi:MAG: hypothetical protein LDL16_09015 [Thiobacillus sp.]|nr:hypothetical protein [Thiobacillus sp.]